MGQLGDKVSFIRRGLTISWVALALSGLIGSAEAVPGTRQGKPVEDEAKAAVIRLGQTPLAFVENRGQVDPRVEFYLRTPGQVVWVTRDGIVFDLQRRTPGSERNVPKPSQRRLLSEARTPRERLVFAQDLVGADLRRRVEAGAARPGVHNYFIGNDPAKWRTGVRRYADVVYRDVWAGIDLKLYGNGRALEQELVVRPGADPARVQVAYRGIEGLAIASDGSLLIRTAFGELHESVPRIYQEIGGKRVEVTGRYKLLSSTTYGFEVGPYERAYALVIDPTLTYSTYLGGSGNDEGHGIAVDASRSAYIAGTTSSADFPLTTGASLLFGEAAFVTKLTPDGSGLVYSTYVQGNGGDQATNIAVDAGGNAYVVGRTNAADFPVVGGFQTTFAGGSYDGFVTKLNASGAIVFSSYLGGTDSDEAMGIAVDPAGNMYVTGDTRSEDFPVGGAFVFQPLPNCSLPLVCVPVLGSFDAFVTKINAGGAIVYSTYLGGSSNDFGNAIVADSAGNAYVTGQTASFDFAPGSGGIGGGRDAFGAKFDATGHLTWSSFLGGSLDDEGLGIAVDAAGDVYIVGQTASADLFSGSEILPFSGATDAFVTKLDLFPVPPSPLPFASAFVWGTFLGSSADDIAGSIALDAVGNAYVSGVTAAGISPGFPTSGGSLPHGAEGVSVFDGFIAVVRGDGSLQYSTRFGGSGNDQLFSIAVDAAGAAYVAGFTQSTDFPTAVPYQGTFNGPTGGDDAFVAKVSPAATTTISSGTNPSPANQNVSFTVTVTIGGSPATSGTVLLYDNLNLVRSQTIFPADNGQVTILYPPSTVGAHTITASYIDTPDLSSLASVSQTVTGGGTTATALSAPLVVVPSGGSSGPQPIGNIRIAETIGGTLSTAGRVVIGLPTGMTFGALPSVSAVVGHGLQIVQTGTEAPRLEPGSNQFSFRVQTPSTGGPAVLLVSGMSAIVPSGVLLGPRTTSVSGAGSGVTDAAVSNMTAVAESTTPTLSTVSNATVGQGADDFTIVLSGVNFAPGASVSFSQPGITVVSITVNSPSQITIKVDVAPGATLGPVDVTVSNPGGSVTLPGGLSITSSPTVTGVSPNPVLRTGDRRTVRLAGTGFQPPTQSPPNVVATISGTGVIVTGVSFNTPLEIVLDVVVAVDAPLTPRTVTVTNPDGGTSTSGAIVTLADPATIVIVGLGPRNQTTTPPPAPTITSISPSNARRGTLISIAGTGFSTTSSADTVTFTGVAGSKVTVTAASATSTSLTVVVPAGAVDGPVVVGVSGVLTNALPFGVTDPALSSVVPETPAVLGGVSILDISGSKFATGSTVQVALSAGAPVGAVNGVSVGSITLVNSTLLTVQITITANAFAGPRDVTVVKADGSTAGRVQAFQIYDPNQVAFSIAVLDAATSQDITATFLPSVDNVSMTLGADGKCTAKAVTPHAVLLRARYIGIGSPPAQARVDITSTHYLGTTINDDCEIDPVTNARTLNASPDAAIGPVGGPAPDIYDPASQTAVASDQGGGVYVVQLYTYDWGASAVVRVSRADAPSVTGTMTVPLDADGDSLPDPFEDATTLNNVTATGAPVIEPNATSGGARVLDRLSATAGGSVKSTADGYTNFEKYRGVYLKGPANGQAGSLQYHVRLGAGQRHLFLRGHGFAGDYRLGAGQCGLQPPSTNLSSVNFNEWTPFTDVAGAPPCPGFEVGAAFAGESIQVHDVTPAFSSTTVFPRQSFQTGVNPTADMGELAYDAYNCNGGEPCDHTSKTGPRNWKFWTYGVSAVGSATQYGVGARVVKKVVDSLFGDRPYEHRTNDPTRVVTDIAGNALLAPLTIVADNSSKGPDDGLIQSEPVDATGKLLGDTYIPNSYVKDFTVFDTNKDSCTELPLVTDPTILPRCADPTAPASVSPQATRQQVVRLMITHEVGHLIGASIYHYTNPASVEYQYTNNWDRDNLFGPEAAPDLRIHNRGQQ